MNKTDQAEAAAPQESQATDRPFWSLVLVQFQTALSFYIFFYALVSFLIDRYGADQAWLSFWEGLLAAVFAVPFVIFAGWAGGVADRVNKRSVIIGTKLGELGVSLIGALTLWLLDGKATEGVPYAIYGAIGLVFLFGVQSALYGPAKYGILPEVLPEERLSWGNGVVDMAAFVGVLFGMLGGHLLYSALHGQMYQLMLILGGLSLVGLGVSTRIPHVSAAAPDLKLSRKPNHYLFTSLRLLAGDRLMMLTVVAISLFWALVTVMLTNTPLWGVHGLGMSMPGSSNPKDILVGPTILTALASTAIALGCMFAGIFSRKRIELGFVAMGGLGFVVFALPLGLVHAGSISPLGVKDVSVLVFVLMTTSLALAAMSAGFYFVPLNAQLQKRAAARSRGGVIAAMNFLNFSAILVAMALYSIFMFAFRFSAPHIFVLCSLMTMGAMVTLMALMPEVLLAFCSMIVTRVVYRIHALGADNIPKEGPALLMSNHISLVDAVLISAVSPRPVRFIVWKELFDNPILGYFLKIMNAIPVESDQRPRALIAALSVASDALKNGELVCIFGEGHQVSRTGLLLPSQRGFRHILTKSPVPIVPIYLEGVWGSIFGYEKKQYRWKWPKRLPYHVQVAVGKPLSHDASVHDIRQSIVNLSADCAVNKKPWMDPVHHRFLEYARNHPRQFCVSDSMKEPNGKGDKAPLNYSRTAIGAIILARRMRSIWENQPMIGLLLPPTVGGALSNIAVAFAGRTSVNLNYTVGPDILQHCINQCKIKTILTSRIFLKRAGIEPPPGCVYLDDLMKKKPTLVEKVAALLAFKLLPARWLESFCGAIENPTSESLFTIIFSSGSTGIPKGVMLTHANIGANIESIERTVSLWSDDRMIGFLPFFHSFGFTVALWGGLCIGFGVIHHPNPLEAKAIGDIVEAYGVTIMVATPTFLQQYSRRVEPEKFQTLEYVLTGAEKLPLRVAQAFEERFGCYVHEGYGTTECAPVVSANYDDYRSQGLFEITNKRGTVGHPAPGIAIRITDIDSGATLPGGETGMIEVRGANIMKGYLMMPEKTAEVIREGGWYVTGDIGFIDDDGFTHITDRLARFSKIGGEMVPHLRIEEELHRIMQCSDQTFAVTSVPDESKGERLVVLHTMEEEKLEGITEKLAEAGLPNIWIPRKSMFFKIDTIPVLGSGKLDLAGVRRAAVKLVEEGAAPAVGAV